MESAGPYTGGDYLGKRPDCYALESSRDVIIANLAYAEGRKAERERCLNVLKKYPDDGKELGDILEAIRLEIKGLI